MLEYFFYIKNIFDLTHNVAQTNNKVKSIHFVLGNLFALRCG
jgi:hypothetical protein